MLTVQGVRYPGAPVRQPVPFQHTAIVSSISKRQSSKKPSRSNFLDGMAEHAEADLGDPSPANWDPGFENIDAMVLPADDDEGYLLARCASSSTPWSFVVPSPGSSEGRHCATMTERASSTSAMSTD